MTRITSIRKRRRQSGFVLSTELLLVTTILAVGLITGLTSLRDNVISELADTGDAIGSISQSFTFVGTNWTSTGSNVAATSSFGYTDAQDNVSGVVGGDTGTVNYAAAASTTTSTSAASLEGVLTY